MNRVIILKSNEDYWEALYIDGVAVTQGHQLGEGQGLLACLQRYAAEYEFGIHDITTMYAKPMDEYLLPDHGQFPTHFNELKENYNDK